MKSTSSLELAANGIKVIMGDIFGYYDYPIGIPRYDTRESYNKAILDCDSIDCPSDLRSKAIGFLNYMGSEDVSIRNPYTLATTTNYHVYDADIVMEAVKSFDENGDALLEKRVEETLGLIEDYKE